MIGRKAIVGLSLLCALAFCAFAAPNAMAGTTAFTCAPVEKGAGFSDEHCDKEVGEGAKFAHKEIPVNQTTEFTLTNEKTLNETKESQDMSLHGPIFGVQTEITCKKVGGKGNLTNKTVETVMRIEGEITMELSECSVTKPASCTVKQPIVYKGKFSNFQNETEMGLEFIPMEAKAPFTEITLEGTKCAVKGTFPVNGSIKGTPGGTAQGKGATLAFTAGMSNLTWGASAYDITGTITWRMKEGNPIVFTTS
jgi:hypothetical protein